MQDDFYYGEAMEEFLFYRVPRLLVTEERYSGLPISAKLLYSLLLDRVCLSMSNGWKDGGGRVYIYYTVKEICEELRCCRDTAMKLLAELEGIGLIARRRQGLGKPDRIYVKRIQPDG